MAEMAILGRPGDTKVVWDSDNEAEVKNAERTFNELVAEGFTGYAVRRSGERGERIREFDPEAESLIMVPRMQGG